MCILYTVHLLHSPSLNQRVFSTESFTYRYCTMFIDQRDFVLIVAITAVEVLKGGVHKLNTIHVFAA